MNADRRKLMIGGAAVVVVALTIWMQMDAAPATPPPAGTNVARAQRGAPAPSPASGPVPALKLGELTGERSEPSGTARNPFRFQPKPVAAPPPPPRPVAGPATDVARPVAPPMASGPPPPPPIPLKFIALVERANGVKWAVLSDGKVTMYGRDGDNIDGRYRIVKIGAESVEVTYLDGRGRQMIRLTGQ